MWNYKFEWFQSSNVARNLSSQETASTSKTRMRSGKFFNNFELLFPRNFPPVLDEVPLEQQVCQQSFTRKCLGVSTGSTCRSAHFRFCLIIRDGKGATAVIKYYRRSLLVSQREDKWNTGRITRALSLFWEILIAKNCKTPNESLQ